MNEQAYVTRLTRASGSNFYYSFLFLPRAQREAIHAVYAFCREVDDSVDGAASPEEAARLVAFWRAELASACGDGNGPTHPIARSLAAHLKAYPIRRRDLEEIIEGVAMDIRPGRFRTFEELRGYCHRVASAVGLVCIEIFGYRDPAARDYAVTLGLAFQLTNILRDVKADAERGRIYMPIEEMERFGCREEDLGAASPRAPFVELMRFQAGRARDLFAQARSLLPERDRPSLFAAEIMRAIYEAILDKIEKRGYDVLRGRVSLSRARKLLIATRVYLKSRSLPATAA
ncbi:MAG TPA: presqualene diphosphate synthase HpnD [Candidatus Polarisedimenticolia bacterium]